MTTTHHPSTKQEIVQYLLKNGPSTAQQVAKAFQISLQGTRRHLKDLEDSGLISHGSVQNGKGRPNYVYQLSAQGRSRAPHSYNEFAVSFLNALVETVPEEQVNAVWSKQWSRKAREYRDRIGSDSLKERITNLVRLRTDEGYMAELHLESGGKGEVQFIIFEHNCAISDVAESFPTVCSHELEMFAAILPDCIVERTQWINNGEPRCGYLIKAKS